MSQKIKKISQLPSAVTILGNDYWIVDQNNVSKKATVNQLIQKIGAVSGSIELRKGDLYLQWRRVGDTEWQNLISLAELSGGQTIDENSIDIRINSGIIQWQFNGGSWYNLISLQELKDAAIPEATVFSGNGTTKEFFPVAGLASVNPKRCLVVVGGVTQQPVVSYTLSLDNGGKLIFDEAPPSVPITVQPY